MEAKVLRAIHEIFECGLALTDVIYTDEQVEEICATFDELSQTNKSATS